MQRSLGAVLWSLVGVLACSLGALSALVGTGAGRALLAAVTRNALEGAVAGRIEIGDAGGSLLTGISLSAVRLYDPDSTLVAELPRVDVDYNPLDLIAGRVVLHSVTLDRPYFNIVQHAHGRLNLEELLRLGGPPTPGPHTPPALVLLRNVRIIDGTVVLRLQDRPSPGDSALEIDPLERDGRRRIRRFDRLNARFAALRLSSPAPRERGIRADITALSTTMSDPVVRLTDLAGRISIAGDSLDADLKRLRMPGSQLAVKGRVRWPRDTVLFDLTIVADSARLADLRFIEHRFPDGASLRGGAVLRSHGTRTLEVRLDPLDLDYRGGNLRGKVTAFTVADSGIVALRQTDVVANDLDLGLAHAFLDTLPFFGHLTGHTVVDGALSGLALEVDWAFRDSLVPGWPVTRVRGRGTVNVSGTQGGGIGFEPFEIEAATVDLGTVRRLEPAITLAGVLDIAGTLSGSTRGPQLSGTLRHRDGDRPASALRGVVRLDGHTDTLGLFVDVVAESLSFDGLRGSFPEVPFVGSVLGPVRLSGALGDLETHFDLVHPGGGRLRGDGVLELATRMGARGFTLRATDVDVAHWLAAGPPSRLTFTVDASLAADSAAPPVGWAGAVLAGSMLAGATLDSGRARLRFADRRVYVDSLGLFQPGLITTGSGALGWRRPDRGTLALDFDADSLNTLDSLVAWVAGPRLARNPSGGETLRGRARAALTVSGALDSLAVEGRGTIERFRLGTWRVPAARARGSWASGPVPRFAVEVSTDSIAWGDAGFGQASAALRGTRDSLTWFARSRIGDLGAFLAGGRFARRREGAATALGIDSLAVLLPGGVWLLERPVVMRATDSALAVGELMLKGGTGGMLVLRGDLPTTGSATASLHLEGFPLGALYGLLQRDTTGIGGSLTATFGVSGTRAQPVYAGSFALNEARFGEFRAPFLDGTIEYRDRRLDGEMHLWRTGRQILNVRAHLPLDLALTAVERRKLPDTLSVRATADSVDLSVLEVVTPQLAQVHGDFSADVGVQGTWDAPRLRGSLQIDSAAATIRALNVRYEGIAGRLALSGDTIRVEALSARSGKGRAVITGYVRLQDLTTPILALDIEAQDFKALELRGYLSITATADLHFRGPVVGATLTGGGTVTSGVLYFADLLTKRVINLDEPDPWIAQLIDTSLAAVIRRQGLGPGFESVFFDKLRIEGLQLAMGTDVWLRSSEANIQLTGTATVNKDQRSYLLSGTLQALRGTYRLVVGPVTREFVVTRGTVRYFGTPDLDAALDIEATHVVHPVATLTQTAPPDLVVRAHIGGTLLVPKLGLSAEGQDLSQTEIISYLLFGQPSFELARDRGGVGGRSAVLGNVAAMLSSKLSGELERTFVSDLGVPLDYFELRPTDPSSPFAGARLAAGWQIGRKTFLVLNAGYCQVQGGPGLDVASTLGASLQFRISPEWRTEASFEPVRTCGTVAAAASTGATARQAGFDLFWERRY